MKNLITLGYFYSVGSHFYLLLVLLLQFILLLALFYVHNLAKLYVNVILTNTF